MQEPLTYSGDSDYPEIVLSSEEVIELLNQVGSLSKRIVDSFGEANPTTIIQSTAYLMAVAFTQRPDLFDLFLKLMEAFAASVAPAVSSARKQLPTEDGSIMWLIPEIAQSGKSDDQQNGIR